MKSRKRKPSSKLGPSGLAPAGALTANTKPLAPNISFEHYWLCAACAATEGGSFPEDHACTVTYGTCPYCKTEHVTLIPWPDFNWPHRRTAHLRD